MHNFCNRHSGSLPHSGVSRFGLCRSSRDFGIFRKSIMQGRPPIIDSLDLNRCHLLIPSMYQAVIPSLGRIKHMDAVLGGTSSCAMACIAPSSFAMVQGASPCLSERFGSESIPFLGVSSSYLGPRHLQEHLKITGPGRGQPKLDERLTLSRGL